MKVLLEKWWNASITERESYEIRPSAGGKGFRLGQVLSFLPRGSCDVLELDGNLAMKIQELRMWLVFEGGFAMCKTARKSGVVTAGGL